MAQVNIQSINNYNLQDAGRKYSVEEEEAEKQAISFPVSRFKRIKPIPGTLGFMIRNLEGGNATVVEHLSNLLGTDGGHKRYEKIKHVIIAWNHLDTYSRKRVDLFDLLCIELNIRRRLFWGWLQEAIWDYEDVMAQIALNGHKNTFVEQLKHHANQPKNQQDRRLMAETLKLTESTAPKVNIVDNSVNTRNEINLDADRVPSFIRTIRTNETKQEKEPDESRMLAEGEQDYIDVEVLNRTERDEILIER